MVYVFYLSFNKKNLNSESYCPRSTLKFEKKTE